MSNGVFNFNFLVLVVFELLGGPKFTLGGPVPLCTPLAEKFCTRGEYFTMSHGVFNFNFLALAFSEILGGPKFALGGPTPPGRPLAEKCFTQSEYFTISNCVYFNSLALVVFELLWVPNLD